MENKSQSSITIKDYIVLISMLVFALTISNRADYTTKNKTDDIKPNNVSDSVKQKQSIKKERAPSEGVTLPVYWGDLGALMIETGIIDKEKIDALYAGRGGLNADKQKFFEEGYNNPVIMTEENAPFLLNLLWAFGLGNKNDILEKGEMANPQYGNPGNFASTGGWTLSSSDAMDHYSKHTLVVLTPEQQEIVERVSKNIYRPCCNNSTHFPDCNHGMAMLGLLELMASRGVSEKEMYRVALQVNALWFPDAYSAIAEYTASKGVDWNDVDPKKILGAEYSSGTGYRNILSQITTPSQKSGGSCGA